VVKSEGRCGLSAAALSFSGGPGGYDSGLRPNKRARRKREASALEYKPWMATLVALLPDCDDLINGYVTNLVVIILQMKNAILDIHNLAADARRAPTESINVRADQTSQKVFHCVISSLPSRISKKYVATTAFVADVRRRFEK